VVVKMDTTKTVRKPSRLGNLKPGDLFQWTPNEQDTIYKVTYKRRKHTFSMWGTYIYTTKEIKSNPLLECCEGPYKGGYKCYRVHLNKNNHDQKSGN
jgi:hypothetical protein